MKCIKIAIKIIIIILTIILVMASYIYYSTRFINENKYEEYSFKYLNKTYGQDKKSLVWESTSVNVIKLSPDKIIYSPHKNKSNINRFLLGLNGNYAVEVILKTGLDYILGPIHIYFNPITKQVIGDDLNFRA